MSKPGKAPFTERALAQLTLVRFREFIREPEALFWVFIFPILLAAGLGIAFRNRPPEVLNIAATTPQLARSLAGEKLLRVAQLPQADAEEALRVGKVALVAEPGANGAVVYAYDPTNPEGRSARMLADGAVERAAGRADPVTSADRLIEEPGSRYIDFLIPGLLGMSLMAGGLWGVGFVTVDMRIRKLLKRFLATPMRKSDFLAGVMISRMLFMVPEVIVLLVFARVAFGVVIYGSLFTVLLLILLGAVTFAGLGLLVASRARTVEAVSGLMNLVMLPMWLLSGLFFSSARFPAAVQPLIKALPLTALLDSLRAVMQEGATLASQLPQVGLLAGWSVVTFFLALRWFRWI